MLTIPTIYVKKKIQFDQCKDPPAGFKPAGGTLSQGLINFNVERLKGGIKRLVLSQDLYG